MDICVLCRNIINFHITGRLLSWPIVKGHKCWLTDGRFVFHWAIKCSGTKYCFVWSQLSPQKLVAIRTCSTHGLTNSVSIQWISTGHLATDWHAVSYRCITMFVLILWLCVFIVLYLFILCFAWSIRDKDVCQYVIMNNCIYRVAVYNCPNLTASSGKFWWRKIYSKGLSNKFLLNFCCYSMLCIKVLSGKI